MDENTPGDKPVSSAQVSRRNFITNAGMSIAGMVALGANAVRGGESPEQPVEEGADGKTGLRKPASAVVLNLQVNGESRRVLADARSSLLDVLREELELTGTKKGCDHGQCGACTVHVNGRRVLACLTLAASVRGPVLTIEGLASGGKLHPMQQAFIDCDAFQCGYCTSGQIMSGISCIQEGNAGTDDSIREHMSGNLCRCGAYPHIVAAIRQVAAQQKEAQA